jgi:integrase
MDTGKVGPTLIRHQRAMLDTAFDAIRNLPIVETQPTHFLRALELGSVSTGVFLRRMHNFALDMGWLPWAILPKKRWPVIRFKEKRAVTMAEHQAIVVGEFNPERRAYYECCWHLGGAQSDIANITAEDIDWRNRIVSFLRQKTGTPSIIRFGSDLEKVLRSLPQSGPLFPHHRIRRETHRSREFARCCQRLGIQGITLHSYRYAWAERAKTCGYPERFAQEALGQNSKAVHRAYARKAQVTLPPLENYEKDMSAATVIPLPFTAFANVELIRSKEDATIGL